VRCDAVVFADFSEAFGFMARVALVAGSSTTTRTGQLVEPGRPGVTGATPAVSRPLLHLRRASAAALMLI
jgi:hypothetical protein